MILTILAAVLAGAAFVLLVRVYWSKVQPSRSSVVLTTAAIVLVAGLAVLAATGRLHWIAAVGAAVFPFLRRGFSLLRFLPLLRRVAPLAGQAFAGRQAHAADAGAGPRSSEVEAAELRMTLHHDSGQMDGEILAVGSFQGRRLSTLDLEELRSLRVALTDADSLRLLESYLDRHHPGWGDAAEGATGAEPSDGQMNEARALEVLGLEAGATQEEVIEAHRRLIQKLHPDRGGSTYLAATLNEAKRVLLPD